MIVLLNDHAWTTTRTSVVTETTHWGERPPAPCPTFYRHWLPQAKNSGLKAVAGCRRRRERWGETKMSDGAGSRDVVGCWRVSLSVCCPRQAPRRNLKALEAKGGGSAQPLAQSTRSVFWMVQISMGPLDFHREFEKLAVLYPKGQSRRIHGKASLMAS